jgi:glycosyltransferase involved in cell wall biosynthesis
LIEAAAMGRPLIATHVPGCRDVVEDGKNGQLCAVKDASDLARAMLRFLDMSAEEQAAMGRASRVLAESRYDQAVVVRRVMDAVRNAVARGARDDG